MPCNEHHKWLKKRHWPVVLGAMLHPDRDVDLLARKYKERDEHGRLPHHWMAAKAQTHTHTLARVGMQSICFNFEALTTRDNEGKTPIDIARRSGACAEIIGLLSLTPEEALSLGGDEMLRLYAPVAYWWAKMVGWIQSRSYADCHKFIDEHEDELVREVLKYDNYILLRAIACRSQTYSDSLVFLALRMIHRHPPSVSVVLADWPAGASLAGLAKNNNACRELVKVLRLTPLDISSTPFPTLLLQCLPSKHHEIYGSYNTVCQFIKHMKYDKAEQVEIEAVLKPARKCDVCSSLPAKPCARCKRAFYCSPSCQKSAWKKHKKTCKAPTSPPATEAELRSLHKGMSLLNMCIQRAGAGDGPTSVVVEFLVAGSAC